MAKIKLSNAEIAALDALIAEMQNDNKVHEVEVPAGLRTSAAILRTAIAVTRVAIRATPYVTEALGGAAALKPGEVDKEMLKDLQGGVSLEELIELRKKIK